MRYAELLRRVAENIQDLRREQGLTQEETAHRAKLSTRALASIERAETSGPALETLHAVAEALGVEVVHLLGPRPEGDRPQAIRRGRKPKKAAVMPKKKAATKEVSVPATKPEEDEAWLAIVRPGGSIRDDD